MSVADRLHVPDSTVRDQRRAADPRASAWVSANAGAGKTKVLTDRVVRLLLDGARARPHPLPHLHQGGGRQHGDPRLRAARRTGSTLDDDGARAPSSPNSTGERPTPDRLRRARRLFARAVETPGGLKIETIHAFCERLLHLVPVRGERAGPLRGARRGAGRRADRRGDARRCWPRPRPAASPALARRARYRDRPRAAGERLSERRSPRP